MNNVLLDSDLEDVGKTFALPTKFLEVRPVITITQSLVSVRLFLYADDSSFYLFFECRDPWLGKPSSNSKPKSGV